MLNYGGWDVLTTDRGGEGGGARDVLNYRGKCCAELQYGWSWEVLNNRRLQSMGDGAV